MLDLSFANLTNNAQTSIEQSTFKYTYMPKMLIMDSLFIRANNHEETYEAILDLQEPEQKNSNVSLISIKMEGRFTANDAIDRLTLVNRNKGVLQVLAPTEYLQRGTNGLNALTNAIKANPRQDKCYPLWRIRYTNQCDGYLVGNAGQLCDNGIASILADPQLQIEDKSRQWYIYDFYSKEVAKHRAAYDNAGLGNVAFIYAAAQRGTLIILNSSSESDVDIPGLNTPRLYNSELMFQAWRDTCNSHAAASAATNRNAGRSTSTTDRTLQNLRFIIRAPIVNQGTHYTIEDVLETSGFTKAQIRAGPRVTFSSSDENPEAFSMLLGTANGLPVARMCADHAESLGGKTVHKVHVWYDMPGSRGYSALVYELA